MVAPKTPLQQHTAAEVEQMTPEQAMATRRGTASYQRGAPERAMLDLQMHTGGGVLSYAAEHVGDLPHRMNHVLSTDITMGDVVPKLQRQNANLHSRYGFEREHGENMESNARYGGEDVGQFRDRTQGLGQKYADAHRGTPVYNHPTEVAVDAAVSLGEGRFHDTRSHLGRLTEMHESGDMQRLLAGTQRRPTAGHQQGMVQYLRGRESRTPAITDAATVMVGGSLPRRGKG